MHYPTTILLVVLAGTASAAVGNWQQCMLDRNYMIAHANTISGGGQNWSGETACSDGAGCVKIKYAANSQHIHQARI
jgi:hypothetical protein